jgi:hypothetical protein
VVVPFVGAFVGAFVVVLVGRLAVEGVVMGPVSRSHPAVEQPVAAGPANVGE